MAYVAGDTILDDEYNAFVNSSSSPYGYNHFAGTGSGAYGLDRLKRFQRYRGQHHHRITVELTVHGDGQHRQPHQRHTDLHGGGFSGRHHSHQGGGKADLATLAASVAAGSHPTALRYHQHWRRAQQPTVVRGTQLPTLRDRSPSPATNVMRAFFNGGGGYIRCNPGTSGFSGRNDKDTVFQELEAAFGNLDIKAQASARSGSGET
jgi:hypothetical protein